MAKLEQLRVNIFHGGLTIDRDPYHRAPGSSSATVTSGGVSMDDYKLHREQRAPVGHRLSRLIEVVTAVVFVLVVVYMILP